MNLELDKKIISASLKKMFDDGWFSICTFEKCCKVLMVYPPPGVSERLHALHCVHFKDMPDEVRSFVHISCTELFDLTVYEIGLKKEVIELPRRRRLKFLGG